MITSAVNGRADLITEGDLGALADADQGPCVSILMPTHRAGAETRQGSIRLRNLVGEAADSLEGQGVTAADAEALLAPLHELVADGEFWQHQADGLALYSSGSRSARFRVPIPLAEEAAVARSFAVRPLLPLLTSHETFFLLALSQNEVRLFEATPGSIVELGLGPVPASLEEALAHEDPERQLQVRSGGGGSAQFHGHGAGSEVDKAALERFLRAVDRGLAERLQGTTHPLVLACVGYYGPMFRSVSHHPRIVEEVVDGNPEHVRPEELHEAAWALVAPTLDDAVEADLERLAVAQGTGKTATGLDEAVAHAAAGRIDTLFVSAGPTAWGVVSDQGEVVTPADDPSLDAEDLVGRAVLGTLRTGGRIHAVTADRLPGTDDAAALLRF